MLRLIDFICDHHRTSILRTRIWPVDCPVDSYAPVGRSCKRCADRQAVGTAVVLPRLDDRANQAIHEAGHVVTALACEYADVSVSMRGSGRPGSAAHFRARVTDAQRDSTGRAVMALAGVAASWRWARQHGCTSDDDMVDVIAGGALDIEDMQERGWSIDQLARLMPDADAVVELHWDAIQRVADRLLACDHLEGEELVALADLNPERIGAAR